MRQRQRQRHLRIVQQKFTNVEADAAGADDCHPLADCSIVFEHVQIRQDHRMIDAIDARRARHDAGSHDDLVKALLQQFFARDAAVQLQLDPGDFQATLEIAQGFLELLLAGNPHRIIELPADTVARIE